MFETALLATCLSGSIDPALVLAIVDRESGGNPHALNVNRREGERLRPLAPDEVAAAAADFVEAGYTVDLGLMQINSENVERLGRTFEDVLEPCTNLALGERILVENVAVAAEHGLHHERGLRTALSLYNTGSLQGGFTNGYVDDVWSRYRAHALERAQTIGSRIELEEADDVPDDRRGISSRVRLRERTGPKEEAVTASGTAEGEE